MLNRLEALEQLNDTFSTIISNMSEAEFYAQIYHGMLDKEVELATEETTRAFRNNYEDALSDFYAAVLVFLVKAKGYFQPSGSGMYAQRSFLVTAL